MFYCSCCGRQINLHLEEHPELQGNDDTEALVFDCDWCNASHLVKRLESRLIVTSTWAGYSLRTNTSERSRRR